MHHLGRCKRGRVCNSGIATGSLLAVCLLIDYAISDILLLVQAGLLITELSILGIAGHL